MLNHDPRISYGEGRQLIISNGLINFKLHSNFSMLDLTNPLVLKVIFESQLVSIPSVFKHPDDIEPEKFYELFKRNTTHIQK